jgi:hypothetical protein
MPCYLEKSLQKPIATCHFWKFSAPYSSQIWQLSARTHSYCCIPSILIENELASRGDLRDSSLPLS